MFICIPVYCILYTVYCKLYTVYCILYTYTVYCILCTLYSIPSTLYTLYSLLCTSIYNVTVHCRQHSAHIFFKSTSMSSERSEFAAEGSELQSLPARTGTHRSIGSSHFLISLEPNCNSAAACLPDVSIANRPLIRNSDKRLSNTLTL